MAKQTQTPQYERRVVVKFRDDVTLPYDGAAREIEARNVGPWAQLVSKFGPISIGPLFSSKTPAQIGELVRRAVARNPDYRPAKLLNYFALTMEVGRDPMLVANALSDWPAVDVAYAEPLPQAPPTVNPDDPRTRAGKQGYLDPAPGGIDARYAWGFVGGDGAGQSIVDLEQGWTFAHKDLLAASITLIAGLNKDYFRHGTQTLGVVAMNDNKKGGVGIAPAASVRCVSQWITRHTFSTPLAIVEAFAVMSPGDVLLLEAQTDFWNYAELPVEVEPAVFDLVQLATQSGIVVVEAAGNGGVSGVDLDTVLSPAGAPVFSRGYRDSGAILVGACLPHVSRRRLTPSCFGRRVDCYAWGQGVDTTDTNTKGLATTRYTGFFSGTSSASAIIAGAALVLQGLAQARPGGQRLDPAVIRAILSKRANGTASENGPLVDKIGVMPDLRRVIHDPAANLSPVPV